MGQSFAITFQPAGGDLLTLGDLEAGHLATIHQWGGMAVEDVVDMFLQAEPQRLLLGNVRGDFVFTSELEQADSGAMLAYFVGMRSYLNQMGSLVVTMRGTQASMSNATFRGLEPTGFNAVRWRLKYTFGIGLIDPAAMDAPA